MNTERPAQLSEEQQVVAEAYLKDLAWQASRQRGLNDFQEQLLDRLEDTITGLEAAGVFLRQSHSKAVIQGYLTRQVEAERRKMQRRF